MKAILDESKDKIGIGLKIFYGVIILICVVAVVAAIALQVNSDKQKQHTEMPKEPSTNISNNNTKTELGDIFKNKVNYETNNSYKINKIKQEEEIVYIGYQKTENKLNDYDLDVNIPCINIQNEKVEQYNKEITDTFEKKAKSILNISNNDIIYTVNYSAYVTNNIISLVIKSTLKEGNSPQRDIVQTYNFDLSNQKECTIQQLLEMKGVTKQQANQKIREEIKKVQANVEELQKSGYNIYSRDINDDRYTINNVTEYFIGDNDALYIVFAYGNENNTSEMDVVVIE